MMRGVLLCFVVAGAMACGKSKTAEPDSSIMFDAEIPDTSGDAGPDTPDSGPESDIGLACRGDDDCGGICITDWEGGYCSDYCSAPEDCPAGSTCSPVDDTTNLCLADCDPSGDDCRTGYGCADSAGFGFPNVCIPGCHDDDDCGEGLACDPTGGFLGEGECYDPDAEWGGACTDEIECPAGGRCFSEDFSGYPGGACVDFGCDVGDNTGCPEGTECLPGGRRGRCYRACDTVDDCRDGYDCETNEDYPDRLTCQPACTDDDVCSGGRVCNVGLGICDVPFDVDDLGTACSTTGNCGGGGCLTEFESGFPGSYCTFVGCDPTQPDESDGCPGDGVCFDGEDFDLCFDGCEEDSDCPRSPDYSCRDIDMDDPSRGKACVPSCMNDDACANDGVGGAPDFSCNPGTGLCTYAFDEDLQGEPCEDEDDCPGGECLSEAEAGYPAGTCVSLGCRLSGTGPEQLCPPSGVCVDDEEGDPEIGRCLTACTTDASGCRPGYECVALGGGTDGACRPACEADGCTGGRTCNDTTGLCE